MTMIHNGVEVKSVIYNGTDLDKVINNGVTVFEKAPSADPVFANNTPEQIQAAVKAGIASTLWKVGDKIPIKLKGTVGNLSLNGTYYAYIIGFDHNKNIESNGAYNLHMKFGKISNDTIIAFVDSGYGSAKTSGTWFNMNNGDTNTGGWGGSRMRTVICPAFYNILPAEWQNVITNCKKYTDNTGGAAGSKETNVTATNDKIWIPSEYEIYGKRTYANTFEQNKQAVYSVFQDKSQKICYKHNVTGTVCGTRLRSVSAADTYFVNIGTNGTASKVVARNSLGFAPCFQIS